ncbi:MAG TPA: AsmA family protein [Gallionellaceae bacterium]|nr:AsmA family protein [Gallionellaceae bacterium]
MLKIINFLKLHPLVFKVMRLAAILVGVVMAVVLYVALVGVSLDISGDTSGLRGKVAAMLTQNLGREVRFDGPMLLEISAHPSLKVRGVHIANAAGFAGGDFASLGEARLALDLWPLLRMRLQIEELSGSAVRIRLQLKKNGSSNWTFNSPRQKNEEKADTATEQAASIELKSLLARLDIKRVSLQNLDVEFIGADTKSHFFELQSLVAQLPAGQPITLTLHGKIEKTHPYQLDFTGGSITELASLDEPWPIDLKLSFMSSQLLLNGQFSADTGAINFAVGTQNLGEFEQLLQTKLPAVRVAYLSGALKYAPGKIALESIGGQMGKTTLNGALHFDYGGARPRVQGELALPALDLRPFLTDSPDDDEPPQSFAELYRKIARATFSLNALNDLDADLTLRVGQWLNLPGGVHDTMLQVKLDHGLLKVPMQVKMADVKLSGSASVDARARPAKFKLALGARDSSLGSLGGLLLGMHDVKGRLGRLDLRVAARGDSGSALMQSLDVQLNVARGNLSYGNGPGERPVQFTLDKLELALPAGESLRGELQGALLDKNFSATLRGSSLSALAQDAPAPFDFEMQAGSASAKIHAVLQAAAQNSASEISFELAAPHSGEIASWLGLKPGADAPINVHGNFSAGSDSWHLSDFSLKLGRSDLSADVLRTFYKGRSLIKLQLTGELLDAEQLQALLPEAKKNAPAASSAALNMMDIPILPSGISLADADISVGISRIVSGTPFAVRDVRFTGQIRDGMMPISPFSANVAENNFSGAILLDLRTQQPHSVIWIASDALDIGRVLKKLGITSNIEAEIAHLSMQLDLHSSRLGQLLAQSEMLVNLEGGHITLTDASSGGKMRIAVEQGELGSAAGVPVNLSVLGSLNSVPVYIGINTARAADLINPNLPLPFEFNVSTADATLKLTGDIDRPFTKKGMELALDMSGIRFDNLNALAQTSLPPWGPWSASGKFHMSSSGYEVSGLQLQVGTSQLSGHGKLDMKVVPPRIDVALNAPTIQLDDFRFGDWSPEKAKPATPEKSQTVLSQKANAASEHAQQILSQEVLSRQNAYLTVQVDQVVSGQDMLGNGKLDARLENGRAALGPVVVNTPGGSASFLLTYEPGKKDVLVNLRAEVKHFDYGILARRIDHKSEMSGVFSLDVDVNAHAQYLSEIFKYGKGHLDFAVWPENLKSGLLDVWAVNVLMALLPAVDSSSESKVNCAIGRFVLADGKLSDKSILIDTSRMRVTGKGGVDFTAGNLQFYVRPRAKKPQFLSFAIPIELSGTFDDFNVGVRAADVVESVGQLATSVIWVPLQMLFGKETPADGHDVCEKVALK